MERIITVNGSGKVSLSPDTIEISLTLNAVEKQYDAAVKKGARQLTQIQEALAPLGFQAEDLKTSYFNVNAEYEYRQEKNGSGRQVLTGYRATHSLKLSFAFDTERMSRILSALSVCQAEPDFSISFTVKDREAVKDELLRQAAENARHKAEVLCAASGCRLGQLLQVNYNWGDMNFYAPTNLMMRAKGACIEEDCAMDITPDSIELSDSASFIYEIL